MPFGGTGTFSGDGFGASGVSDRTKKVLLDPSAFLRVIFYSKQ